MKKILVSFVSLAAAICTLHSQNIFNIRAEEALNNSEWFKLRDIYREGKDSLSPILKTFSECMLAHSFNHNKEACRAIDRLVGEFKTEIGNDNVKSMLFMKSASLKRMGRYTEAASVLDDVCRTLKSSADSTLLSFYSEFREQYEILAQYKDVNEVAISDDEGVAPFRLDSIGRSGKRSVAIMLPAIVNGIAQDIVFDSGAGVNIVSARTAKRLGLDVYNIGSQVKGIDIQQGGFAVAKEVALGNVTVKNVPFYVVDVSSGVDSIDVYMKHFDMILGVELIQSVKEFHLDFARSAIVIPNETTVIAHEELPNMCYSANNGLFCIDAKIQGVSRLIHWDTGAVLSSLESPYYALYSDSISTHCVADSVRIAGIGGYSIEKTYNLHNVTLTVAGVSYTFPIIPVAIGSNRSSCLGYANLGIDYILRFSKVIYNTDKMFARLVP